VEYECKYTSKDKQIQGRTNDLIQNKITDINIVVEIEKEYD
jgi:hypothetical protein